MADDARTKALAAYRKKLLEHREVEAKVKEGKLAMLEQDSTSLGHCPKITTPTFGNMILRLRRGFVDSSFTRRTSV